jgi:hypothetical protein
LAAGLVAGFSAAGLPTGRSAVAGLAPGFAPSAVFGFDFAAALAFASSYAGADFVLTTPVLKSAGFAVAAIAGRPWFADARNSVFFEASSRCCTWADVASV